MAEITVEDLERFKTQLLSDISSLISNKLNIFQTVERGIKTSDAREMLGCSNNKLVSLRVKKRLRTKKIDGTLYYNRADMENLLKFGYE